MMTPNFHSTKHRPDLNEMVCDLVSSILWPEGGKRFTSGTFCSLGVSDGSNLVAGVIYHNADPDSGVIELSSASRSRRWMNKSVLRSMFDVPFYILGMNLAVHRVSGDNQHMIKQFRRFGHNEYIVPHLSGPNISQHIFTLTKDEWEKHPLKVLTNNSRVHA